MELKWGRRQLWVVLVVFFSLDVVTLCDCAGNKTFNNENLISN